MEENDKNNENNENIEKCLICKKNGITYCCMPCRCAILCKTCAMKMATGGKCRKCEKLFSECKRLS